MLANRHFVAAVMLAAAALGETAVSAREWTDAAGNFLGHGEIVATSADTVVVKTPEGNLVGIAITELSGDDQQFVRQVQAAELRAAEQAAQAEPPSEQADPDPKLQTWLTREGYELKGDVIGFAQREIVISRVTRLIDVNGTAFSNLHPVAQFVVLRTVAEFDDPSVKTERDLNEWVKKQGGQPRAFQIEGVQLELDDGSNVTVPFFVFAEQELSALRPGWEQWKSAQANDAARSREDFLTSVQAREYQQQRQQELAHKQQLEQQQAQARQIQMLQTQLEAAIGLTTIWQVELRPPPGMFGRPLAVMVSAPNSLQAQQMAAARFPGYVPGAVRAINR